MSTARNPGKSSFSLSSFSFFFLFSTDSFLSFLSFLYFLSFLLFFSFFSFLISFPFHFSSFSLLLWSFFSPFLENHHSVNGRKLPPHFLKPRCGSLFFHISFSFFFLYDIITHMASCEPWNFFSHTWLIVSHSFKWTTWFCQVSLF